MERGDIHFGIFVILVGTLFFFMITGMTYESGHVISENMTLNGSVVDGSGYRSFCAKYSDEEREEDNHEYTGNCIIYFDEIISTSGVVIGMEYLGKNSVKYNINAEKRKSVHEGESLRYKFEDGEKFTLTVEDILYLPKHEERSFTSFDYVLSKEKSRSFCEGIFCTIYLNDELHIEEHEIEFEKFCVDVKDCDITIEIDGKDYEVENLKEGSVRRFENLTLSFEEFNIKKKYMRFKHNFRMAGIFCNDSDRGQDYFNIGTIRGFYENENYTYGEGKVEPLKFTDYCYDLTPILIEFYCNKDEYLVAERHLCEGECIDGRCISSENLDNDSAIEEVVNISMEDELSISHYRKENQSDLYHKIKEKKSLFGRFFAWLF